jgi:hypothetical protein
VLRLPALAEDGNPLRRLPGRPLWAHEVYGYGQRQAMHQLRPRPLEGAMFLLSKMPIVEPAMMPQLPQCVRAWA